MKTTLSPIRTVAAAAPWLLLALGMAWGSTACGPSPPGPDMAPAEARKVAVRTQPAASEEVRDTASLPADLRPLRRATLSAEVAGNLEELRVEEGDRIRRGEILARIDTRALEQNVAEAEAVERRALARFERANRLFEKRSITQQQLLDAVTDRDVATARLASARLALQKSSIRAPWEGEVARRRAEVGDYVAPGQPVLEILDSSRLKVRASAAAADVRFLTVGSPVSFHLEGREGEAFSGELVRLAAELDPATRTLEVEAEIPNRKGRLKPGMFGRLTLTRQVLRDAVTIPLEALVDLGGQDAVFIAREGLAERREVELGPTIGRRVVVLEGVTAGDRIVVAGQQALGPGQPVTEAAGREEPSPSP